jgi:hypothetical protein
MKGGCHCGAVRYETTGESINDLNSKPCCVVFSIIAIICQQVPHQCPMNRARAK